jgi:hypothetical protein
MGCLNKTYTIFVLLKFIKIMYIKRISILFFALLLVSSCAIIRPGDVGIKQKFGKMSKKASTEGVIFYNPFISKVIVTSIQTKNLELSISLPSKEGLSVTSQISILYRLDKTMVQKVISTYGLRYESIISSIFRSASSGGGGGSRTNPPSKTGIIKACSRGRTSSRALQPRTKDSPNPLFALTWAYLVCIRGAIRNTSGDDGEHGKTEQDLKTRARRSHLSVSPQLIRRKGHLKSAHAHERLRGKIVFVEKL